MGYANIMVHLDIEKPSESRLKLACDLAGRFRAALIGVAACEATPPYAALGDFARDLYSHERTRVTEMLTSSEKVFRDVTGTRGVRAQWRSGFAPPTGFVAGHARAADLIVVGADREGILSDPLRQLNPNELVMVAGRPVLVVPPDVDRVAAERVLVAWCDTREARRAVRDALPFLTTAREVRVVEIVESEADHPVASERLSDVTQWLGNHGAKAAASVIVSRRRVTEELNALCGEGVDLLVAGAYGHTRLREWILGGVTRDLVMRPQCCALLSH